MVPTGTATVPGFGDFSSNLATNVSAFGEMLTPSDFGEMRRPALHVPIPGAGPG